MRALPQEDFEYQRVLAALRQFVADSALTEKRISMMMGIATESLQSWLSGTTSPRQKSLQEVRAFLERHGSEYLNSALLPGRNVISQGTQSYPEESEIATWFQPWTNF